MKMGTIHSPSRYEEMRSYALRRPESRREAPERYAISRLFAPFL
jgi:hypothetical protein